MDHLGDEFFRLLYKKHNQQKQKKMSGITSDLEASAQQKKTNQYNGNAVYRMEERTC